MQQTLRVHRLKPALTYNNSALIPSLMRHMHGFQAAWIHYPFFGGAEFAALGARRERIPYAVSFHMDVVAGGARGALLKAHQRTIAPLILGGARAVTVGSRDHALHSSLRTHRPRQLVELPYGVDTELYSPGRVSPDERGALGLDPRRPIVLFVGGMDVPHAFKGVDVLLHAFAEAHLDHDAQLALVGNGALRPGYEEAARRLGVAHQVRFLGGVSEKDLIRLYRAAAVTVLPSTTEEEAFGIVLIEAMACGSPVIASALPGVRTVVGEGDNAAGIAVAANDPAALAAAIALLVRDDRMRAGHAKTALRIARERYSQEAERRQLARVVRLLV